MPSSQHSVSWGKNMFIPCLSFDEDIVKAAPSFNLIDEIKYMFSKKIHSVKSFLCSVKSNFYSVKSVLYSVKNNFYFSD